jgi:hypothetical protein
MLPPVRLKSPHPDKVPPILGRELRVISEEVQEGLGLPLPPISIRMTCFFATKPRHFAAQEGFRPAIIYLCPDLADEPITRIRGILYHEFGHLLQNYEKAITGVVDQGGRDYEQDCDHKVEAVTGIRIYYDSERLQRAGPGARGRRPRPRGLT